MDLSIVGIFPEMLKLLSYFLLFGGLFFILTELISKFDKSFLYAGLLLFLFSILMLMSIGINTKGKSPDQILNYVRTFQLFACLAMPLIINYFVIVTKYKNQNLMRLTIFFTLILMILNFSPYVITLKNGHVIAGFLYKVIFGAAAIYLLIIPIKLINISVKNKTKEQIKTLKWYLLGIIALVTPTIAVSIITIPEPFVGSMMTPGNLLLFGGFSIFGLIVMVIFIQRFILILKERQLAHEKLESAYAELDHANSLKELGQSTAIINHEIKNYTFMISGNTQLIIDYDKQLSEATKTKLQAIVDTTKRMSDFSQDILELSKAKIIKEKTEISICGVMKRCIESHFHTKTNCFSFSGFETDPSIYGDWNKLDHVFINIFKNALDADATSIFIKATKTTTVLLLVIEDNGVGCNEKAFKNLFTPFYTTKKNSHGTGLGMPIIKSIVESHGGHISAYSKNMTEGKQHGLILNLCFPIYKAIESMSEVPQQDVILVKEGLFNLGRIIRIFQNVHFTPHIVQSLSDIVLRGFSPEHMMVLANPENIVKLQKKNEKYHSYALITNDETPPQILKVSKDLPPQAFSEEFVIAHFVNKKDAA